MYNQFMMHGQKNMKQFYCLSLYFYFILFFIYFWYTFLYTVCHSTYSNPQSVVSLSLQLTAFNLRICGLLSCDKRTQAVQ